LPNASDEVGALRPDIVIISTSESNWSFRACQQIYMLHPQVATVMVSFEQNEGYAEKAVNSGAIGYIAPIPESSVEFCDQLKRIYHNEQSRISMLLESSGVKKKAEVITVFGTKGGIGKTTLAVNLAVALSRQKFKVVILDFDLAFGDVHMYLGLDAKETIAELVTDQRVPTIDSIRSYLVMHSSGVQAICAPSSPEYAEGISAASLEPIINILRSHYDYIIVDTAASFSELNLLMLEASSTILYVTGLDISLLHNSKKGLLLLDSLNQKSKVKVIVSKDFKGDITVFDVEKIMDLPVVAKIPHNYSEAVRALNQGIPLVAGINKSGIAKEIIRLAEVIGDVKPQTKKFSLKFSSPFANKKQGVKKK